MSCLDNIPLASAIALDDVITYLDEGSLKFVDGRYPFESTEGLVTDLSKLRDGLLTRLQAARATDPEHKPLDGSAVKRQAERVRALCPCNGECAED